MMYLTHHIGVKQENISMRKDQRTTIYETQMLLNDTQYP
jgi:hypothetical protein